MIAQEGAIVFLRQALTNEYISKHEFMIAFYFVIRLVLSLFFQLELDVDVDFQVAYLRFQVNLFVVGSSVSRLNSNLFGLHFRHQTWI